MKQLQFELPDEAATQQRAAELIRLLPLQFSYVAFSGGLGAGKTHSVRAMLRALGFQGAVRSPTYTLLEDYEVGGRHLIHMDLYRLSEPEELEYLGLRELLDQPILLCVEWPEKAQGFLPKPDISWDLQLREQGGRRLQLTGHSAMGQSCLAAWSEQTLRLSSSGRSKDLT